MTEPANDTSGQTSTPNPVVEFPPVSYLTMAYEAVNTRHAVINAIEQDYRGDKTIILIHQEPGVKVESDLINIVNTRASGDWPGLWLAKLEAFVAVASQKSIAIWWDEDDMFDVGYTLHAVLPIPVMGAVGAWNPYCCYVKRGEIVHGKYGRTNGTLAVKVDALREVVPEVRKIHPKGYRVVRGMDLTVDPTLVKLLGEKYGDKMMDHSGMRYYFLRSGGNGGPRRVGTGVNIDEV